MKVGICDDAIRKRRMEREKRRIRGDRGGSLDVVYGGLR